MKMFAPLLQISFLLPFSKPKSGEKRPWANPGIRSITESVDVDFKWMSVLFERGFNHEIVRGTQENQTILTSSKNSYTTLNYQVYQQNQIISLQKRAL
jgi:hypothetical protein